MWRFFRQVILRTALGRVIRRKLSRNTVVFETSGSYWDSRYQRGGSSGGGSYGRLAVFKANVVNAFVKTRGVTRVIEFGCGDGNQLALADYPSYLGIDVSHTAVTMCRERFLADSTKSFLSLSEYNGQTAELALSLDVVYHLVEDEIFVQYMETLFNSAEKYVIIYSSDHRDTSYSGSHIKHRAFTSWVDSNRPDYRLIEKVPNAFPWDKEDPKNTSFADFHVYQRICVQ